MNIVSDLSVVVIAFVLATQGELSLVFIATKFVIDMDNTKLNRGGNQVIIDTLRSSFNSARDIFTVKIAKNKATKNR